MARLFESPDNVLDLISSLSEHSKSRSNWRGKPRERAKGSGQIAPEPYAINYRWQVGKMRRAK